MKQTGSKAKPTQRMLSWAAHQKKLGHEVRMTKNGYPYAAVRSGGQRLRPSRNSH